MLFVLSHLLNSIFPLFQKKVEDAKAQMQFIDIDKELQKLKRAISTSDKQAAADLCAAKDQLRSLRGTVCKINQERSEVHNW